MKTRSDFIKALERPSMHYPGGDWYMAAAAFMHGVMQANENLFPGIFEYAHERSGIHNLGWSYLLLLDAGFSAPDARVMANGENRDREQNRQALAAMRAFLTDYSDILNGEVN
jgi:hypothetical protein